MAITNNIRATRELTVALYTISHNLLRAANINTDSCTLVRDQFPELRGVAIHTFPEYQESSRNWEVINTPRELADLVNRGMAWHTTTEGQSYWDRIYWRLMDALNWDALLSNPLDTQAPTEAVIKVYDITLDKERSW